MEKQRFSNLIWRLIEKSGLNARINYGINKPDYYLNTTMVCIAEF